jgi:hypothetical protein
MNPITTPLMVTAALTTALAAPSIAFARPVTLTINMANYGGRGAYLAIYLTDAAGAYAGSLWMAGGKAKYYRHLSDWARLTGGDPAQVDGITGASVGAGGTLELTMDVADALFDAGYTLHVDAAVEEMRDSPNEITLPLDNANSGNVVQGRLYIADFAAAY